MIICEREVPHPAPLPKAMKQTQKLFQILIFIYLTALGLSCNPQDLLCMAWGIFSSRLLVMSCGSSSLHWELSPPALGGWSLNDWATMEVPSNFINVFTVNNYRKTKVKYRNQGALRILRHL